jgi:ABC-type dipeptide/oligopeptide/nickel transport system permease subunit
VRRGSSIGAVIVVIWLIIGAIAAGQRGYFNGTTDNCAEAGTVLVTIVAGPLNYVGLNPKVDCKLPEPSK